MRRSQEKFWRQRSLVDEPDSVIFTLRFTKILESKTSACLMVRSSSASPHDPGSSDCSTRSCLSQDMPNVRRGGCHCWLSLTVKGPNNGTTTSQYFFHPRLTCSSSCFVSLPIGKSELVSSSSNRRIELSNATRRREQQQQHRKRIILLSTNGNKPPSEPSSKRGWAHTLCYVRTHPYTGHTSNEYLQSRDTRPPQAQVLRNYELTFHIERENKRRVRDPARIPQQYAGSSAMI